MTDVVGALHDFHDPDYAEDWARRFVPTPGRLRLFEAMIESLLEVSLPAPRVLELGTGPGYFAERLLEALPGIAYQGLDFSDPMRGLAAERLRAHSGRMVLTKADLLGDDWESAVLLPVGAVVSTWALHDLGSEQHTGSIYAACRRLLPPGGVLLNGDFVKPEGTSRTFEPGRFPVARHLELLREVGFRDARCLVYLEEELENPTSAQNYACLRGVA